MPSAAVADRRRKSRVGRFVDRVFRNPDTGELVIVQLPNAPLAIYLVLTAVRLLLHPAGTAGTVVSIGSGVALAWWALDEVARGESLFRRILGGAVLASMALRHLLG